MRVWRHPLQAGRLALGLALLSTLCLALALVAWRARPAFTERARAATAALAQLPPMPAPVEPVDADLGARAARFRALGLHPREEATRLLALLENAVPAGARVRELQWDPAAAEDLLVLEWRGPSDAGALAERLEALGPYRRVALDQQSGPQGLQRSALRLQR